jgi:hypothetical protein
VGKVSVETCRCGDENIFTEFEIATFYDEHGF